MAAVELRRWTREEYDKMVEAGILGPEDHVELLDGEIFRMTPQGPEHFARIRGVEETLRAAFGAGFDVRTQGPLALDPMSEPEPDVAVVRGTWRDYLRDHPSAPLLLVEVSMSNLAYDRERKRSLYARAGLQEYWLVNLRDRRLEVYRDPAPAPEARYGWSYRSVQHLVPGDTIAPLAAPEAPVRIAEFLD